MLRPEEMCKLRIFCPKGKIKVVIDELHKAKAIDVIEHDKSEEIDIGTPIKESGKISDAAIKARSLIHMLGLSESSGFALKKPGKKKENNEELKKIIKSTLEIYDEVIENNNKLKEIENRINVVNKNKEQIQKIESLGIGLEYYRETGNLKYLVGHVGDLKGFGEELKKNVKNNYEFHLNPSHDNLVSVFFDKNKEWQLLNVLRNRGFQEIKIPDEYKGVKEPLKKIEKELKELNKEKNNIQSKLNNIKQKHQKEIMENERLLTINARKAEAPLMFGETKNISIITGWVPTKKKPKLVKKLNEVTSDKIHILEEEPGKDEEAPIKLENPKAAKPYEFLLRMFSMPSYKEIDPTIFMFITFPLFFGLMMGDIGYGLLTIILFTMMKRLFPAGRDLFNILTYCGISSIIFGVIYGEFFGFYVTKLAFIENWATSNGIEFFIRDPKDMVSVYSLMAIAGILGVLHVNFGLLLGFINVYKKHGFKMAVYEKFGWVMLEIGAVLIALSMFGILPINIYPGLGVIFIGIIMLYKGEGLKGVVELPQIFVHISSYLRLMAIGIAKKGLGTVVNTQSMLLFQAGPLGIVGGVLVFIFGHALNFALGVFGPFIHSLRLHYVEYFTKFYEGGGKEFEPFGAEK
ncbi:MAG: V-type ATP synthase subunit I [Nanoarchaeota archaeon]